VLDKGAGPSLQLSIPFVDDVVNGLALDFTGCLPGGGRDVRNVWMKVWRDGMGCKE
jgi:hypothetical protein